MKIKINVTKSDIKLGERNSCSYCPVALAINRAIKKYAIRAAVSYESTALRRGKIDLFEMENPVRVRNFIENFDDEESVKPISFYLKLEYEN